jgi:hypothetical protein
MSATAGRYLVVGLIFISLVTACSAEKPVEPPRKAEPAKIVRPRREVLTPEQRQELGFCRPDQMESPRAWRRSLLRDRSFLREPEGRKGAETERFVGFSVRTKKAEELIISFRAGLRVKGYLIFRSRESYGDLPDLVTVVKGNNTYDILNIQATEAPIH